jgi:hypothetical protein
MEDGVGHRLGDREADVAEAIRDNPYALSVRGDLGPQNGDLLGSRWDLPPCWLGRHGAWCAQPSGVHAPGVRQEQAIGRVALVGGLRVAAWCRDPVVVWR